MLNKFSRGLLAAEKQQRSSKKEVLEEYLASQNKE
jgi:hypothetical protein